MASEIPPSPEVAGHEPFVCIEHGAVVPDSVCPICLVELREAWAKEHARNASMRNLIAWTLTVGVCVIVALVLAAMSKGVWELLT